jgi:hypothetical protein
MSRVRVTKTALVRAIRENCIQCSGYSRSELENCTVEHCPFWLYRFGIEEAQLERASLPTRERASSTRQNPPTEGPLAGNPPLVDELVGSPSSHGRGASTARLDGGE